MIAQIDTYAKTSFTAPIAGKDKTFDVYRRGSGPPVILMQELPGIGQESLAFADRIVEAGYEAWLPHWFGPLGRMSMSPIVDWMRALVRHAGQETGRERVGVIGMCLSGNFAMTLIAEPNVWAAVAAQPSLPRDQRALHMSADEIAASRAAIDQKGAMRAYRFAGDKLCTGARFEAIDGAFNDGATRVVLNVLPGGKHSVFAGHYDDAPASPTRAALLDVLGYFKERLG